MNTTQTAQTSQTSQSSQSSQTSQTSQTGQAARVVEQLVDERFGAAFAWGRPDEAKPDDPVTTNAAADQLADELAHFDHYRNQYTDHSQREG